MWLIYCLYNAVTFPLTENHCPLGRICIFTDFRSKSLVPFPEHGSNSLGANELSH